VLEDMIEGWILFVANSFEVFVGEVCEDGNDGVEYKTDEDNRKVKFLFAF